MNPQDLPKGPGAEANDLAGKKPLNVAGVYRHEAAGKEVIIMPDPKLGTSAGDALVRMGFHWIAPPPTRQALTDMQNAQAKQDAQNEKKGIPAPTPVTPGEQDVIFNGTSRDTGGPGDTELALAAENQVLKDKLAALENPPEETNEEGK
jgi:hypothetical protein